MTCRPVLIAALLLLVDGAPAAAQTRVFVVNGVYESADLAAPNAALLFLPPASMSRRAPITWTLGLRGSTLTVDAVKMTSQKRGWLLGGSATPFSANGSTRVYRDGRRDTALSFQDRSFMGEAGVRVALTSAWQADILIVALKESVDGVDIDAWRRPYGGLSIRQSYRRVAADDPLRSRFDGIKITAAASRFLGAVSWWRGQLTASGGKVAGPLALSGHASAFDGGGLNVVSRFLVGGSWDGADGLPLYGFHYAQFRLDRGAILNGGADVRIAGRLDVGIRGGLLESPRIRATGTAMTLGAIWNGVAWRAGVGIPGRVRGESRGAPFVFASVTAAVIH